MIRSVIEARVRILARISTGDVADTQLDLILDEGVHTVSSMYRWPFLRKSVDVTTVTDTELYAIQADLLVTDFNMPIMVYSNDTRDVLTPITELQRDTIYAGDPPTGIPATMWYVTDTQEYLGLLPVPTAGEASEYKFVYYKTPTLMTTDSHAPEWHSSFHDILVWYTLAQLYERQEYYQQAAAAEQKFARRVSDMKRFYKSLSHPSPNPMIYGGAKMWDDPWANWPAGLKWGY